MKKQKISIVQLLRMYPNDQVAKEQIEAWRWRGNVCCTHCKSYSVIETKHPTMDYHCRTCRKRFSVRTNTIMTKSQLGYQVWIITLYIAATGIKGTSSTRLASELDITQKSAWYLSQRIRAAWQLDNKLNGEIEVDETYFGGKEGNKHESQKLKNGRGIAHKIAVIGLKQRDGIVRAKVVKDTKAPTLQQFIKDNVALGTTIYTDEHRSYKGLNQNYNHRVVNHSKGEYVRGRTHTNSIEGFWANLKRAYYGTFHHISEKHLQRYLDEFTNRQNLRKIDTLDQIEIIAQGMFNKTLPYKGLIQ